MPVSVNCLRLFGKNTFSLCEMQGNEQNRMSIENSHLDLAPTEDAADSDPTKKSQALREFLTEEVRQLESDQRVALLQQLREYSDQRMNTAKQSQASLRPRPRSSQAQRMTPARMALGLTFGVLFLLGFVGFWYGMVVGVPHQDTGSPSQSSPKWESVAQYAWCALLTWMLIRGMKVGKFAEALAVARQVTPGILGLNVVVIGATVAVAVLLDQLFPWLDRSWLYLLPGFHNHATNVAMIPLHIKYFGFAFLLLLAVNIPQLAQAEEVKYRGNTVDWRDGMVRSVRFGLAHCVVGVPLYAGLALTVGGLWFTYQYLQGGVDRSTLHHATYNWIVLMAAMAVAVALIFH
jgi:hypothetical protein